MRVYKKFYIIFVCLNVDNDKKKTRCQNVGKTFVRFTFEKI